MTTRADVIAWLEEQSRPAMLYTDSAFGRITPQQAEMNREWTHRAACARAALDCVRACALLESREVHGVEHDYDEETDTHWFACPTNKGYVRAPTPVAAILAAAQTPERDK